MNWHVRSRYLGALLALLLPVAGAWAQSGGSAAASSKIGVLNMQRAIMATQEGKQAVLQMNVEFAPRYTDLDNLQKQISDLQNRLSSGARTLSEDEKARIQRQGELLAHEFQRKQDDLTEESQAAQGDIIDAIGRKMLETIDKYSRDNAYAIVLNSSAQGAPVVYGSSQLDIEQEIIRLYDQDHPVKAGTSSDAKPDPKPATPAASTAAPRRPATPAAASPAPSR